MPCSMTVASFIAACLVPAFILSLALTALMRRIAPRLGLIDKPAARKVHTTPTPLGGGIAIWVAIAMPLIAGLIVVAVVQQGILPDDVVPEFAARYLPGISQQSGKLLGLLVASALLMLLGLADDARGLAWQCRLGAQTLIALACVILIDDLRLTLFIDMPIPTGA